VPFGSNPVLFGDHQADLAFPTASQLRKITKPCVMGRGCRGFLNARNGQRWPSKEGIQRQNGKFSSEQGICHGRSGLLLLSTTLFSFSLEISQDFTS